MTDEPPIESEAVEIVTAAPNQLAVVPNVEAGDLVQRLGVIRNAMATAMEEGIDYGLIPGAQKPSLFKPGAEKLGVLFQLDVQIVNEKTWGPGDHLTVVSHATVYHAPTQTRMGYGEGICTTREKKYGKRQGQRVCPDCDQPAIIKGKQEYGGGWVCFKKKGGCGNKWSDGADVIESQVSEIDNPEIPDLWNTVDKMASKRSRIDAILAVTGASALFTQDLEDMAENPDPVPVPAKPDKPRLLTDDERKRVNDAITRAGRKIPDTYAAVGVGSRGIDVEHAKAIRVLLDNGIKEGANDVEFSDAQIAEARLAMSEHDALIEF